MGRAGAGKSLQGRLLADQMAIPWLSAGEFLRMVVSGPPRRQMLAGELLPDNVTISLISKMLGLVDVRQECIVDGFPRTKSQAEWLLEQVKKPDGRSITAVIHLLISPALAMRRLLVRGRPDDNPEAIKQRLEEYSQEIEPIVARFKKAGTTVHEIDASQSVEQVHALVWSVVGQFSAA